MSRTSAHGREVHRGGARGASGAGAAAAVAVVALAVGGCSGGPPLELVGARPSPTPSVHLLPIPTPEVPDAVAAPGSRWAYVTTSDGTRLPDAARTPGAAFGDVTQADVCDLHYTQGVRQPRFNAKVEAFAAYGISIHDRDEYAVDHLIPIGLGGSNSMENLWPQPREGAFAAAQKNQLENRLRALVCSGTVPLPEAQAAIAKDWRAAVDHYAGMPVGPGGQVFLGPTGPTKAPDPVANGAPCAVEGEVGRTRGKGVRFTCTRGADGQLRWSKRY